MHKIINTVCAGISRFGCTMSTNIISNNTVLLLKSSQLFVSHGFIEGEAMDKYNNRSIIRSGICVANHLIVYKQSDVFSEVTHR